MSNATTSRIFIIGIAVEGGLGLLGLGLAVLTGLDIIGMLVPGSAGGAAGGAAAAPVRTVAIDAALGVAATLPPLAVFLYALRSRWPPLSRIRDTLERELMPHIKGLGIPHLVLLAGLAGAGEELFFRGFLQSALALPFGEVIALLLAAAVFGLLHWITPFYALYAGIFGVYLGALFLLTGELRPGGMLTGGLIAPILCHAIYDLVALWVLHHRVRRRGTVEEHTAHRRAGKAGHLPAGMEGGAPDVGQNDDVVE